MRLADFFGKYLVCAGAVVAGGAMIIGCGPDNGKEGEEFSDDLYNIRLTEIHYHPADIDGELDSEDSLEFLELKNTGSTKLTLAGLEFTEGFDYVFSSGTSLPPGDFFVIASSKSYFKRRYGFDPDGVYSGGLKNSCEQIQLKHVASNKIIVDQTYSDTGSWPGSADGGGYSLVPKNVDPGRGDTTADSWRASTAIHGSPGADDLLKTFDSTLLDLRITEINYHPSYPDTAYEDSLEFIEIKNVGSKTLNIGDVEISGGIDYKFDDNATIAAGEFKVLASSSNWFKQRYGFDPDGVFEGQLKNSSETVTLKDKKAATVIVTITYMDGNPWPDEPDGDGRTLVPMHSNPTLEEQPNAPAWRKSFRDMGSPGADDPEAILVNEILSHTDEPQVDAIELYNPNTIDIDLGGWYLTDELVNPVKYRIPDGTIITAGGYKVFTANEFNADTSLPNSFALSEFGDDAYVMSDSTGCRGYCHGFSFGPLENGIAYGRYIVPSTGNEVFVPLRDVTLGAENSGPLVGPLVISEVLFRSDDGNSDFFEVTNISQQEVVLYDKTYTDNTWRVQNDSINAIFPQNMSIKSGESVVMVSDRISVDDFRTKYSIGTEVQLFTFTGTLPDVSAKLELDKPVEPEKNSDGTIKDPSDVDYMGYDKISYKAESPWPIPASGQSITRVSNTEFGNDPGNWIAAEPTPGKIE